MLSVLLLYSPPNWGSFQVNIKVSVMYFNFLLFGYWIIWIRILLGWVVFWMLLGGISARWIMGARS